MLPREMGVGISLQFIFYCYIPETFSNPNPMWLSLQKPHARKLPSSQLIHLASGLKKSGK